jgi:hypothetical protein
VNPKSITMKMPVASEVKQEDERDCLSDSHRSFMIRYVEFEILKQQRISERFLRDKVSVEPKLARKVVRAS